MNIPRSSGILLPVFSLPSKYGIGTFGKAAYEFVDFLKTAGQRWWQILPVGPTSYGDSPYQSFSAYAGNPYFIDPEMLIEDGLLTKADCDSFDFGSDETRVDYGKIYENRFTLLKKAFDAGYEKDKAALAEFEKENAFWLDDYALFMALKRHFGMKPWTQWNDDIRLREPAAVARYEKELEEDVLFFKYMQLLFFRQWDALKSYAEENGIGVIGDIPIYVAMDSADVWSAPEYFQLDEDNVPVEVAGVPPDAFTEDGQLWGNPLYRWDKMKSDGFGWWIRRIGGAGKLYDVLRIDHFRGLESYWAVPYGEKTAKIGRWVKGPGMDLVGTLTSWFSGMQFIAEDLGYLTPDVHKLLKESGLPGMKVLEFAFDAETPSAYLPHNYDKNCVCYAGTHDNETLMQWRKSQRRADMAFCRKYLGLNPKEGFCSGMLRAGMGSVATLFVAQLQDWLELGAEARINTPGKPDGNWQWRLADGLLTKELSERIYEMTERYGRLTADE